MTTSATPPVAQRTPDPVTATTPGDGATGGAVLQPEVSNCLFHPSSAEDPDCTNRILTSGFGIELPVTEAR